MALSNLVLSDPVGPASSVIINVGPFDAVAASTGSFVVDLSKGFMGTRYASAPDFWNLGVGDGVLAHIGNVSRNYIITVDVDGYNTTSSNFNVNFLFQPRWNLPL